MDSVPSVFDDLFAVEGKDPIASASSVGDGEVDDKVAKEEISTHHNVTIEKLMDVVTTSPETVCETEGIVRTSTTISLTPEEVAVEEIISTEIHLRNVSISNNDFASLEDEKVSFSENVSQDAASLDTPTSTLDTLANTLDTPKNTLDTPTKLSGAETTASIESNKEKLEIHAKKYVNANKSKKILNSISWWSWSTYIISIAYCLVVLIFFFLRIPEILSLVSLNPFTILLLGVVVVTMTSLVFSPPSKYSFMLRRMGLIALVCLQIKQAIDQSLKNDLPHRSLDHSVVIVTGANSGTGFAVSKHLVGLGAKVIMACRSSSKCEKAATKIGQHYPNISHHIVPMQLDLSDLESVWSFTQQFSNRFGRLDVLINNAGLYSEAGGRSKQGLEELFGAMHLGHFALTKWLIPLLQKPLSTSLRSFLEPARVINVASCAFVIGNFHPSLMSNDSAAVGFGDLHGEITDNCGKNMSCCPFLRLCPNTNGYARAKLANVLHARELQKVLDREVVSYRRKNKIMFSSDLELGNKSDNTFRRVVTASLHPGSVNTNIFPGIRLLSPFLRSSDDAGYVLLHAVLDDTFTPGSYIDAMKQHHHLGSTEDTQRILRRHFEAFPLPDLMNSSLSTVSNMLFSLPNMVWMQNWFIAPLEKGSYFKSDEVAAKLWVVSDDIVEAWMKSTGKSSALLEKEASVAEDSLVDLVINHLEEGIVVTKIPDGGSIVNEGKEVGRSRRLPLHKRALQALKKFVGKILGMFNFLNIRLT